MIHVYNGTKFKVNHKCQSSADLISHYALDHLDEPEKFDKELRKGNHVYCWVSQFEMEINDKLFMFWSSKEEEAKDDYYHDSSDNI